VSPGSTLAEPLGERIARARRNAGLTQKDLALRLGVSLWTVESLERGSADAPRYLEAVAQATRAGESWLRGDESGNSGLADVDEQGALAVAEAAPTLEERPEPQTDEAGGRTIVLGSLAGLTLIRFFTEVVHVLPRAANFVDVPIFALLIVAAVRRPRSVTEEAGRSPKFLVGGLIFLAICAISVVANPSRVEAGPALVFVYGFLAPLGVYYAVYRLWPVGQALSLSRLIVALGLIQLLVVATIDLPRFLRDQNPDIVSGTFGENAYQLVFFLLLFACVLAGVFTFERQRWVARFAPPLFVAILAVIFLAQYRALLLTTALTVLAIGAILGSARARGILVGGIAVIAFVGAFSFVAQQFPVLKFADTLQTFKADPALYVGTRLGAAKNAVRLFSDRPPFIITGSGPGTYSSRGWQTFALSDSRSPSNAVGKYVLALTGGKIYHTDVSDKYTRASLKDANSVTGSTAVSSPFSSYTSLLGEVGLLGAVVMVALYFMALVQAGRMVITALRRPRSGDPLVALAFGSAAAFYLLLQLAFLDNWLEVTRITFFSWALLAVTTKEFSARYGGGTT
jgi:transcriptional regulator with XRE-family HTH domain